MECEQTWGKDATVPATGGTSRLLMFGGPGTASDDTTVEHTEVMEMMEETLEALPQVVPVCNDLYAFQIKSGKFMLAWIIISAMQCR